MSAKSACPELSESLRSALRAFSRDHSGSAVVEGAIAISILVGAFVGLMAIVQEIYATERMGRAARAAARAVALNPQADTCAAMRSELGLAEGFDCESQWQITIDRGVSPSRLSTLIAGETQDESDDGELVLVRIGWKQVAPETDPNLESELGTIDAETVSGDDAAPPSDSSDTESNVALVSMVAMGVARSEPEAG